MPKRDLTKFLEKVVKNLDGGVTISDMSKVRVPYADRIPFGIMDLDIATKGGWPRGTVNEIFGPDGIGKNLIANMNIAECQQKYGDACSVFYMSLGYRPDRDFMRKCGVKVKFSDDELEAMGIDPATATDEQRGEEIGNLVFIDVAQNAEAAKQPSENLFTAATECIESGYFQLGIIDEMASGETKDNVKKGLGDEQRVATWANLVTGFVRKVYTALRKFDENGDPNGTCIVVLQPVRANMDAHTSKYNPFTIPSGHALKHLKALDLHLRSGGNMPTESGDKVGKITKWKIAKGKFGLSEGAEGEFSFRFFQHDGTGGVDPIGCMVAAAKAMGTITSRGRYHYILHYEDRIEGGLEGVVELLRISPTLVGELREATLLAARTGELPT